MALAKGQSLASGPLPRDDSAGSPAPALENTESPAPVSNSSSSRPFNGVLLCVKLSYVRLKYRSPTRSSSSSSLCLNQRLIRSWLRWPFQALFFFFFFFCGKLTKYDTEAPVKVKLRPVFHRRA